MEDSNGNISILNITNGTSHLLNSSQCRNISSFCSSSVEIDSNIYVLKIVINCVIFPILTITGVFGNICTIVIFYRKKAQASSTILISGLAVSDLLLITFRWIANVYSIGHVFFTESIRFVRPNSFFWMYMALIPQRIGNHLILSIVLERLTAVWYPLKFKELWTTKRAKSILFATILINLCDLLSAIRILIFSLREEIPKQGDISSADEMERYLQIGGRFFQFCSLAYRVIGDMLPLILVIVFNSVIVVGIRRNSLKKSQKRKDKETNMTRMLLGVSMIYFLLCSPLNITMTGIIIGVFDMSEVSIILYETMSTLIVLNSVINFFVYGLCNKSIRDEYLALWHCKKEHSDSSTTTTGSTLKY